MRTCGARREVILSTQEGHASKKNPVALLNCTRPRLVACTMHIHICISDAGSLLCVLRATRRHRRRHTHRCCPVCVNESLRMSCASSQLPARVGAGDRSDHTLSRGTNSKPSSTQRSNIEEGHSPADSTASQTRNRSGCQGCAEFPMGTFANCAATRSSASDRNVCSKAQTASGRCCPERSRREAHAGRGAV